MSRKLRHLLALPHRHIRAVEDEEIDDTELDTDPPTMTPDSPSATDWQERAKQLEGWLNAAADAVGGCDLDMVASAIKVRLQSSPQPEPETDAPVITHGSVQGTIHEWHTGARPMFFKLRELSTGELVRCEHDQALYGRVHEATGTPNTVIHAYGQITWDRTTNAIINVEANAIDLAEPISEIEFERLLGSAPHFTGTMSTADYIDWLRGDAD